MHANALARDAEMPAVLMPPSPGIFSATGLLTTDLKRDAAVTVMRRLDAARAPPSSNRPTPASRGAGARSSSRRASNPARSGSGARSTSATWVESYELTVAAPPSFDGEARGELLERFHAEHDRTYGFSAEAEPVECVSLRLTTVGKISKPPSGCSNPARRPPRRRRGPSSSPSRPATSTAPSTDRYLLPAQARLDGPAVIEEFDSTTVVHPGYAFRVDIHGNLFIEREGSVSSEYGIVVSKNVMIAMRDGIRLATDLYRPARDGELVPGRYPTIVCITPYDKGERRYTEIADFFVPKGYAVVLQDLRDRHRSEGTKEYFHSATPHTGEDGYDTIEWIAAQPWSNGRTGMVGSSYAGSPSCGRRSRTRPI